MEAKHGRDGALSRRLPSERNDADGVFAAVKALLSLHWMTNGGGQREKEKGRQVKVVVESDPAEPKSVFTVLLANGRRIESGWRYGEADPARLIRMCKAG
jgi:hypothetical protein